MARRISLDSADFDFAGPFEDEFCRFANPAGRKRLGVCLAECSSGEDRPVDVEVLDNEAVARHAEPESLFHTLGQGPKGLLGLPLTGGAVDRDADFGSGVFTQDPCRQGIGIGEAAGIGGAEKQSPIEEFTGVFCAAQPCRRDPHENHTSTFRIVSAGLRQLDRGAK